MILRTGDIVEFLLKAGKALGAKVQRQLLKSIFTLYPNFTNFTEKVIKAKLKYKWLSEKSYLFCQGLKTINKKLKTINPSNGYSKNYLG